MHWSTQEAQEYAQGGRIEEWIDAYLRTGKWKNEGLADGLKKSQRWWIGPVLVPVAGMSRTCGPEVQMAYKVTQAHWDTKTGEMAQSLDDPLSLPPVILEDVGGTLCLRDGNHRHQAAEKKGWQSMWAVIWFNSEEAMKASPFYAREPARNNGTPRQR